MPPLGRERVISYVEQGHVHFSFGSPHACVAIVPQEGKFRIRELVVDADEARDAMQKAMMERRSFMPEHYAQLARPTGKIFAEASSPQELVTIMRTMHWPDNW